jgi:hypothetical protein
MSADMAHEKDHLDVEGKQSSRFASAPTSFVTPLDLSPWPEAEAAIPTSHPGYSLFEYCQLFRCHGLGRAVARLSPY